MGAHSWNPSTQAAEALLTYKAHLVYLRNAKSCIQLIQKGGEMPERSRGTKPPVLTPTLGPSKPRACMGLRGLCWSPAPARFFLVKRQGVFSGRAPCSYSVGNVLNESMPLPFPSLTAAYWKHVVVTTTSSRIWKRRGNTIFTRRGAVAGLPLKSSRSVFELMEWAVIFLSPVYENALCLHAKRL